MCGEIIYTSYPGLKPLSLKKRRKISDIVQSDNPQTTTITLLINTNDK